MDTLVSKRLHLCIISHSSPCVLLIFVFSKSFRRERSKAARASFHLFTTWMFLSLFFCPTIVAIQRTLAIHGFFYQRVADLGLTAHIPNVCHATQNTCTLSLYLTSGLCRLFTYYHHLPGHMTHVLELACWVGSMLTLWVGLETTSVFMGFFFVSLYCPFPESVPPFVCSLGWIRGVQANKIGRKKERKEARMYGWNGIAKTAQGDKMWWICRHGMLGEMCVSFFFPILFSTCFFLFLHR